MEKKFEIDPPVNGNAFRVVIDKAHTSGANIQGRFDLWVVKNSDYKIKEIEAVPKRAMMDLNGVFTASSAWSNPWNKPRLDSKRSIYSGKGQDYSP
jgi:hypothetical protein